MEDNFLYSFICTEVYKNWFIFFIDIFLKEIMNIISQRKLLYKNKIFTHSPLYACSRHSLVVVEGHCSV